ncbi:MAG: TonB-dependent receptor, partial [Candidatus Binatia bacterium]
MRTRTIVPKGASATIAAFTSMFVALAAEAQDEVRSVAPPMIEEIVVTAQKRAQSAQDVPITIKALSGEDLSARGIGSVTDLQYATPGLVIDDVATIPIIYLRGVGTDAFLLSADLSVANYVDGVYFPFSLSTVKSLSSVERVEVIKGPQGTLFGRNATGGAISVVTKEPSEDAYTGSIDVGYGSFDHFTQRGFVSGPMFETVSFSLSGLHSAKSHYYDVAPESPVDHLRDEREYAGSAKLRWRPSELFDVTVAGYGTDTQGVAGAVLVNERPSLLASLLSAQPVRADYEDAGNVEPQYSNTNYVGSVTANLHPGPFDVKSITAYQDLAANTYFDFDGTTVPIFDAESHQPNDGLSAKTFTEELQFLSNEEGWLSRFDVEWIAGFYFLNNTAGFTNLDLKILGGLPVGLVPGLADGLVFHTSGILDTKSYAGFAQSTWSPLSWSALTVGARYQFEERRAHRVDLDLSLRNDEGGEG